MTFAERLNEKIIEKKLLNKDIGFECSCSGWLVSQWRNGHSKPDAERLKILAEFLGVTEEWLIYGKEEETEKPDDIRRNGSGYFDPTAYMAMQNMERGDRNMEINKGEIWQVNNQSGTVMAVVLNVHENHCNILCLKDEKEEGSVPVVAQGIKYTNPAMVSYKMKRGFISYIRTMKDTDFENLVCKVRKSLGFGDENAKVEEPVKESGIVDHDAEIDRLKKLNADLTMEKEILKIQNDALNSANEQSDEIRISMAKVEAERDLYKQFYEQLFERVVAR